MDKDKPEIKIDISSDYDSSGMDAAVSAEEVLVSTSDNAASSTENLTATTEQVSATLVEAASSATTYSTALDPLSVSSDKAAKSQKVLGEELDQTASTCNAATSKISGATNQINAGTAAAGGMANIISAGGEAASGAIPNIGMLATSFMALGVAIKSCLGPIGWVILGIQAVVAGVKLFISWLNKAKLAREELAKADAIAWQKSIDLLKKLAETKRATQLEESADHVSEAFSAAADASARANETALIALQREEQSASHHATLAELRADTDKAHIDSLLAAGKLSEEDAITRKNDITDTLNTELAAIEELSRKRQMRAKEDAASRAKQESEAMAAALKKNYSKLEPITLVKLPSEAEMAKIEQRLATLDEDEPEYKALEKRRKEIVGIGINLKNHMEDLGISVEGGWKANIEFVRNLQKQTEEAKKVATAKAREAALAEEAVITQQQINDAGRVESQLRKKSLEAQAEADAVQAAANAEETARNEAWQDMQSSSLQEQAQWLRAQLSTLKSSSKSYKEIEDNLKVIKGKIIIEELDGITASTKTIESYVSKNSRTASEIWAADKQALRARRRQLQALLSTPNMDAATLKTINSELRGTEKELHALKKSVAASRPEAQRMLESFKMPNMKPHHAAIEGNLKAMSKAYERTAKRAERAAAKGDTKALDRYQKSLSRMALTMERQTGYSGVALTQHRKVAENLKQLAASTNNTNKGETAKERQIRLTNVELRGDTKARAKGRKAVDASTREQNKLTAATKKQAAQAAKKAQKSPVQEIATLSSALSQAQSQLTQANSQLGALNTNIAGIAAAASSMASQCTQLANTSAARLKSMQSSIESLKRAINNLRSQ